MPSSSVNLSAMASVADRVFDALDAQAASIAGIAHIVHAAVRAEPSVGDAKALATRLDEDALRARLEVERTLFGTLRSPVDPDDLYGVSCVLDASRRAFVRSLHSLGRPEAPPPLEPSAAVSEVVVRSAEEINGAIAFLRKGAYDSVLQAASNLRRSRRDGRALYYVALHRALSEIEDERAAVMAMGKLDEIDGLLAQCAQVGARLGWLACKHQ